jgi:hypothetical protein
LNKEPPETSVSSPIDSSHQESQNAALKRHNKNTIAEDYDLFRSSFEAQENIIGDHVRTAKSTPLSSPARPNQSTIAETNANLKCKFNGYSNAEIVLFFGMALVVSLLFYLKQSHIIYQVI